MDLTILLFAAVAALGSVCAKWAPGEGHYETSIVIYAFPNEAIDAWLPKGLQRMKPPLPVPPGTHPVISAFGMQYHVHPTIDPKAFDLSYKEYIMSIPYVGWDPSEAPKFRYKGPFTYSPRLFLNNTEAILLGDLFGLAKKLGHFNVTNDEMKYTIWDEHDWSLLINLDTTSMSPYAPPAKYPNFKAISDGMNAPIVAKSNYTGDWECAHFTWLLETAEVASIEGSTEIYQPFLKNLPVSKTMFKGIATHPMGAFHLKTNWTMSFPLFCEALKPSNTLPKHAKPTKTADPTAKQKIAVLGGGLGSISAAYYLTEDPDWQQKYDITVYQLGWRLGGKAASGRGQDSRILEHGLHFMLGWYNNVFQWVQDMYKANNRPPTSPLATWKEAFIPTSNVRLPVLHDKKHVWEHFGLYYPVSTKEPGPGPSLTPWDYLERLLEWLGHHNHTLQHNINQHDALRFYNTRALNTITDNDQNRYHLVALLDDLLNKMQSKEGKNVFSLSWPVPIPSGKESVEAIEYMVDIALIYVTVITKGILADKVDKYGFGIMDDTTIDDWCVKHGWPQDKMDNPITRGGHDLVFAYINGDTDKPSFAGGVSLFGFLSMTMGYKGSVFYRMMSGMGDTILGPAYQVLAKRGVKFQFFQKVTGIHNSGDMVTSIDMNQQATVKAGDSNYNPLHDVKGLPSWSGVPDYDQLVEGKTIEDNHINLESSWNGWAGVRNYTLKQGVDFDIVLSGISVAAMKYLTKDLQAQNAEWKQFMSTSATVATQAVQLWMYGTTEELGFPIVRYHNKSDEFPYPTASGYVNPFNTWADMTNLLPQEDWSGSGGRDGREPQSIQYLCGTYKFDTNNLPPFTDTTFPQRALQDVKKQALDFIPKYMPFYFANTDNQTIWASLVAPLNVTGTARLDYQYLRVNVDPAELYTLSNPGTIKYRKKAYDTGFKNLYAVGDWTDTAINAGCAEAAVTSGLLAANHLSGYPKNFTSYFKAFNMTGIID